MLPLLLLFAAGLLVVWAVGGYVFARPAGADNGPTARRAHAARDALLRELGAPTAALGILLAGLAATVAVCWPLGRLAAHVEKAIDVPVFKWASRHAGHHTWTDLNKALTLMGNRFEVKLVCLVSIVVLTVLWRRRVWWIPAVAIAASFGLEKYGQKLLSLVVHRGHPVTGAGTYPSGGCARLISIYGTILFLVVLRYPQISRRWRVALWTLLGTAAFVEGYTRFYLLKHWLTDIIGGWVFGSLLLFVLIAATATLVARSDARSISPPTARRIPEPSSAEPAAVG
jgi:membrane-associated phospholipid phosphatase